jgi:hypothetical protein
MTGYELILSLSYPILIQLLIISYLYHILCTKRALRVFGVQKTTPFLEKRLPEFQT